MIDDVKQADLPKQNVRMDHGSWAALRKIAARHGYLNGFGRKAGEGNVAAMLLEIARGALFVSVDDEYERECVADRAREAEAARIEYEKRR